MNNLKLSLTISLLLVSILGGSQAFAESVKVQIGKFSKDKELIILSEDDINKTSHSGYCSNTSDYSIPAYIRINNIKIQPVCWYPARMDGVGVVVPIGEDIDFNERNIKFRDATLDLDKKKIR